MNEQIEAGVDGADCAGVLAAASEQGFVRVSEGVYLHERDSIIEEQKSWSDEDGAKKMDFSAAPFWLTDDSGSAPIAVHGAEDKELINAIDRQFIERPYTPQLTVTVNF